MSAERRPSRAPSESSAKKTTRMVAGTTDTQRRLSTLESAASAAGTPQPEGPVRRQALSQSSSNGRRGGSAGDLKLPPPVRAAPEWAAWLVEDVWRLHHKFGWHLIPVDATKRPLVRWVNGAVNLREHRPTEATLTNWFGLAPAGWAVACGGPSRLVVLDIEGAGMRDLGPGGQRIHGCLAWLPEYCLRPTPSGGMHAFFHVVDGDVPSASGSKLIRGPEVPPERGPLLAEFRTHGHYVVVLGTDRANLALDFRPMAITGTALEAIFEDLRQAAATTTRGGRGSGTVKGGIGRPTLDASAVLAQLPEGAPCRRVRDRLDEALKLMTQNRLTPGILGPVMMLVRLGACGHVGVTGALEELHTAFIQRVAIRGNRAGGVAAAQEQWSRSQSGAFRQVFGTTREVPRNTVCECWLTGWKLAYASAPALLRSKFGQQRTTDKDVVDYLYKAARCSRSRSVRESQRQIAEWADRGLKPVNKSLARLEAQGWISRQSHAVGPDTIELRIPASEETTTEQTSPPTGGY